MYFDIALHYHRTIKVKQHEQKHTLKRDIITASHHLPSPTGSGMLTAKVPQRVVVNHGESRSTQVESQAKCMYGNLRYPALSRVTCWNCTCEVVRGSSLLPALLAAVLAEGGSPLSAGFIIWAMSGWFCFSRRIRVIRE